MCTFRRSKIKSKIAEVTASTVPYEIWQEILDNLDTSRPFPNIIEVTTLRRRTLRALSQTCQVWRRIFFPMLWHNFEVDLGVDASVKQVSIARRTIEGVIQCVEPLGCQPFIQ